MSIVSELQRISNAKDAIAQQIEGKGVTVPQADTIDDYPELIGQISGGSGGIPAELFRADGVDDFGELDLSGLTVVVPRAHALHGCGFSKVKFYKCTQIPNSFLTSSENLREFVVSNADITSIKDSAFQGCRNLTTFEIPDTISTISDCAFQNCPLFELDALPNSITNIGENAFSGCTNVVLDHFPTGNSINIGGKAFSSSGVKFKEIPQNVNIENANRLFSGCSGITELKIRCSKLGRQVLGENQNLKHVWISNNCATINTYSSVQASPFLYDPGLTDIYCEASEQPAGWEAYWNYTSTNKSATVHWGVSEADFDDIVQSEE